MANPASVAYSMEIIKPLRIILNTKPFLFRKTGVGYYTYNLFKGLLESKDVSVYPALDIPSTSLLRHMSSLSQRVRRVFGNSILKVTVPLGDFLISKREEANKIPEAEIYHETNYDRIPTGNWRAVATIHDLVFLRHPEYLPKDVVSKCKANFENISNADRFIVTTKTIKEEFMDFTGTHADRIDITPLASSGKYYPVNKDLKESRRIVDKYTRDRYILYVGTIEPRKNIKILLKAFRIIRNTFDIKLILAGDKGWMYDDILKLPGELGIKDDVIFTGYVNEQTILHLYNFASVFVYPSVYEGFGIPVVEAMSCGVPVVISDIPSLREVAGDAALSFKHDDHYQLADKVEQIITLEPLSKELSRKSLQRAGEFSWDKTVLSTIRTYYRTIED